MLGCLLQMSNYDKYKTRSGADGVACPSMWWPSVTMTQTRHATYESLIFISSNIFQTAYLFFAIGYGEC